MKRKLQVLLLLLLVCAVIALSLLGNGCSPQEESLTLFDVGPITLDPAVARGGSSIRYIVEIFSGLVCFDPDLKLIPDIAESWKRSSDGRTYTFHLRHGVKFHDGKEVKASDFKYSMERACDPATGSQTAETYLDDIVGVKERLLGEVEEIRGIKAIDDYTLQITIDASKEYFLSKLTYPTAFVVDQANEELILLPFLELKWSRTIGILPPILV